MFRWIFPRRVPVFREGEGTRPERRGGGRGAPSPPPPPPPPPPRAHSLMVGWRGWWAAWRGYEQALRRAPVLTQSLVGGGLWCAGDLTVQELVEGRSGGPLDLRRAALAGAYGFGFVGPFGHTWYKWLDRVSGAWSRGPGLSRTAGKLALDTFAFGPFSVAVLFVHMGLGEGESPQVIRRKLEEDLLPTVLLDSAFWVPFQCANFTLVPPRHNLLAVNLACLADSCLLSWAKHADVASLLHGAWGRRMPPQEPGGEGEAGGAAAPRPGPG